MPFTQAAIPEPNNFALLAVIDRAIVLKGA
jgi:hypothetical protein